jgi:RHS repeat-associated protein
MNTITRTKTKIVMKNIYILMVFIFSPVVVLSQTTTKNYIKSTTYQVKTQNGTINAGNSEPLTEDDKIETITYFDGLGRPIQSIAKQAGGNKQDIITPVVYDDFGRQAISYLPYANAGQAPGTGSLDFYNQTNLIQNIESLYINKYPEEVFYDGSINAYSEQLFESSPLNRILKVGAPGKDWKINEYSGTYDRAIQFDWQTNASNEVKLFSVAHPTGDTEQTQLVYDGHFNQHELFKTITMDENHISFTGKNHSVEEFKDKQGRVVLKRTYNENQPHDTHYVYDDFGNLTYVIPPKAAEVIVTQVPGNQSGVVWQQNFPWVDLVNVDSKFAELYNKKLSDYKDKDVRDADIENEYGGQGGFALIAYRDGTYSIDIDFSSIKGLDLKQGEIAHFPKNFRIKDTDLGNISNQNYNYKFSIANNAIVIKGSGKLTALNQEFFSTNNNFIETIDLEVLDGLCYIYHYDYRNRLIEKKIPGKGWEHIVYNTLDQPILTQDKLLRNQNKWLFTKYDAFGRVVYTGEYSYPPNGAAENAGRIELQNLANNQNPANIFETKLNSGTTLIDGVNLEYSNNSFPTNNLVLFTVNFYDDYNFGFINNFPFQSPYYQQYSNLTKSLPTATMVRVLETNHWISSVNYYNDKAQIIYSASKNPYLQSFDATALELDFTGKILRSKTTHLKDGEAPIVIEDTYTYDHAKRLLTQTQTINNQAPELIINNSYDEFGQLINKKVGGVVANNVTQSNGLQSIDYAFNIRGWLRSINNGTTNNGDLFGFKLNYNNPEISTKPLYNGNISETFWQTANDNNLRGYDYEYDALNRLKKANYHGNYIIANSANQIEDYSLSNVNYDPNGNILSLQRTGLIPTGGIGNWQVDIIDNLDYFYENNSNKLVSVNDTATEEGFKDGLNSDDDYTYDDNGNMIADLNKNITNIEYNHLNLPVRILFSDGGPMGNNEIKYTYDALGVKLKKEVINREGFYVANTETMYAGNMIYEKRPYSNNCNTPPCDPPQFKLKFFSHPEGYVEPNQQGGFDYVYQYKDHLGNVRLSYSDNDGNGTVDSSEIIEENNYYPFGMKHEGYNSNVSSHTNSAASKYKYNGKEMEEALGLDWYHYGARFYDPTIGRWFTPDALTEKYLADSPYGYSMNNPVLFVDPDGNVVEICCDELKSALKGVGATLWGEVTGTYEFLTNDAWNSEIWQGLGNVALGIIVSGVTNTPGGMSNPATLYATDATLGTNTTDAMAAVNESLDSWGNDLVNGNTEQKAAALTSAALFFTPGKLDDLGRLAKLTKFPLENLSLKNVPTLQGKADLGWFDGETLNFDINSILKGVDAPKGAAFTELTQFAENLAKESGLKNVRLQFGPVMNQRLANDASWAKEYGYHFSSSTDDLGNTIVTWEKSLD